MAGKMARKVLLVAVLLALGASAPLAAQERPAPRDTPAPGAPEADARGWLGVGLDHRMRCPGPGSAAADGSPGEDAGTSADGCGHVLVVETVVVGSPADQAGVLPGDTLLRVESEPVVTETGRLDLPAFEVGGKTRLLLGREGGRVTLAVRPAPRPERPGLVPMKVHRLPDRPERPPAAGRARAGPTPGAPRVLMAPVPAGSARDVRREVRVGVIHDSVLAAAREQLDSVREIRREQMREMQARMREVRRTIREAGEDGAAVGARLERALEREGEELQRLDSVFEAWDARGGREAMEVAGERAARAARQVRNARRLGAFGELRTDSRVHRLGGAELLTLHPELAESFEGAERGLLVLRTLPGTPAAAIGLRAGDVIVEAAGVTIVEAADLQDALVGHADRDSTVVRWIRKGEPMQGAMRDR